MSTGEDHQYGSRPPLSDDYGGTGQTRTRLPDRAGPARGGAGRRPSRGLVLLAAVVALLIAAIAFANQGGGEDDNSSDSPGAAAPATDPTAPSGNRPTQPENTSGIPTGFAHSKEGAQSAAANYAVSLVSADILKPDRREQLVQNLFVADRGQALREQFDKAYSPDFLAKIGLDAKGNAASGQTYVSRTLPIGTKLPAYSESAATVEVWCTGVFGTAAADSTNPVTSDWFTMTLKLRWENEGWKVDSFSQKSGPAPVNGDNKVSSADDIAKAVEEYGGFTYAR
ncbi:hypothetical protein [Streptomyces sp. NPDC007088]|uniref:hypothetical protein n=1 Tax=Streptomyces sp. NPDC007088 TaxID=3364773 RepID=UPI003691CDAD